MGGEIFKISTRICTQSRDQPFINGYTPPASHCRTRKEQVQVMWRDTSNQVHAQAPEESPRGMGYGGILTSDMFGLRTTLDNSTERLLRLRHRFTIKTVLSSTQANRLRRIDKKLESRFHNCPLG